MIFILAALCIFLLVYMANLKDRYDRLILNLTMLCEGTVKLNSRLENEVKTLSDSNSHIAKKLFDLENKLQRKEL